MTDEHTPVLICPPWYLKQPHVEAYERHCVECGIMVAVARSSDGVFKKHPDTKVYCHTCANKLIDEALEDNPDEDIDIRWAHQTYPVPPV